MDGEEELHSFCEEYINGNSTERIMKSIIASIHADILNLIKALGVHLTSTNVDQRCLATKLLSEVLDEFCSSGKILSEDDVHYLVDFLCDRLKDHTIIVPHVLSGLLTLVTGPGLHANGVVLISRSIFKELHCQALHYEDRHKVFSILLEFLTAPVQALEQLSEEVIMGYVEVLAGERDPRNLLLAFSSVVLILHNFHFNVLTEELFEVVSCYFPIDFSAVPGEDGVSRESLVLGLSKCLSATPKFAELSLPLLVEKLSSDVLSAKLDSLQTLVSAVSVCGGCALSEHLFSLWSTIRTEMFKSVNQVVQEGCVAVVTAIATASSQPHGGNQLRAFIEMALQDCQQPLIEPGLMQPAVHLLAAVAMATQTAASSITAVAMPILLAQFSANTQESHQRSVLDAVHVLVRGVAAASATDMEAASPLLLCKDPLLRLLASALQHREAKLCQAAIHLLSDLAQAPGLLDSAEVLEYGQRLMALAGTTCSSSHDNNINTTDGHHGLRGSVSGCMSALCRTHPLLAQEYFISPLLTHLMDASSQKKVWLLPYLCPSPSLAELLLPRLIQTMQQLLGPAKSSPADDDMWQIVCSISSVMLKVVEQLEGQAPTLLSAAHVQSLISMCVEATHSRSTCYRQQVREWVELIARVLSSCAKHAGSRWCEQTMGSILAAVSTDGIEKLHTSDFLCVPLLAALLQAAPAEMVSVWGVDLCEPLKKVGSLPMDNESTLHAARAYASILNKAGDASWLAAVVQKHTNQLWISLTSCGEQQEDPSPSKEDLGLVPGLGPLRLWIWLTKALLMRGHKEGMSTGHKLLELCICSDVGVMREEAANGFRLILSDQQDALNMNCHATIKLFYKQQLFVSILPHLVQGISEVVEGRKQHLLTALSHLLAAVPHQVVLGELHKVLPLLLESLSSEDAGVKQSSLNTVLGILQATPNSFSSYLPSLLPLILTLTSDPIAMVIRRKALDCVGVLSTLPSYVVYPYQQHVIRALTPCVDDRKRLVRKAAVEARALWYLL